MTTRNDPVVAARNLKKHYVRGSETVRALDGVDFEIHAGEMVALVGPSGSGKTTLMNLISCLDQPTEGELRIGGRDLAKARERELVSVRRELIGFVFQRFHLIPTLTAAENVELPTLFARKKPSPSQIEKRLAQVGLAHLANVPAFQLSGGDKQRTAIARALVNDPKLLIADEPTGKLESAVRDALAEQFRALASEGLAVFIATHDLELADRCDRVLFLQDGRRVARGESVLFAEAH